jgi:hypothetical protein
LSFKPIKIWENCEMNEIDDDQLFEELLNLKVEVVSEVDDEELMPIYDEYFSSKVFDNYSDDFDSFEDNETKASDSPCWDGYKQIGMKRSKAGKMVPNCVPVDEKSAKQKLKDPKGGLTAAGRAHFNRTEGSNLKPGVKGAADTPEKMRRKGSFLTRFFTNPSGPMVDEKGRATRLALSAAAWGERVPKNAEDAAKLAAKGKRLLERYQNTKKKDDSESVEEKQLQGQTIGQQRGGTIGATAQGSLDMVDADGDGMIFDGTPDEQRVPYKRQSNTDYEKRRRKFVRGQLASQGIKPNRDVADRSKKERDARARARAAFDKQTVRAGAEAQAQIGRANTDAARDRRNQAQSDRLTGQAQRSSAADRKPADRIDNSPPARRIDSAERVQANRGKTTGVSDAATRRGQTDSRRPTSADDRRRPDSIDKGTGNRVAGDQPVRVGRQEAQGTRDAATRRGQTDSRRPTSADDRRRPDSVDRGTGNRVAGDQPVRVGRQEAQGTRDAATRRGQTDSRRPTSADDRRGADRTDRSAPNRKPDSADRASRSEYKPGYILEDADGQLQQYDGKDPKDREYIKEQRDGTLQLYGPDKRTGANDKRRPDNIDRSNPNKIKPGNRRRDDIRPVGKPTIDRPRIGESRGSQGPTIDRPRLPGNQYKRTSGQNRNIRNF